VATVGNQITTFPILGRGYRTMAEWALVRELFHTSAFDKF
jgi:hypothetical protein